jgi:hypothetical protein
MIKGYIYWLVIDMFDEITDELSRFMIKPVINSLFMMSRSTQTAKHLGGAVGPDFLL